MEHIIELANKLEYNEYSALCSILNKNLNKRKREIIIKSLPDICNKIIADYNYKICDDLDVCEGGNLEIHLTIIFINKMELTIGVGAEGEFYKTNNEGGYEFGKKYTNLKLDNTNIKNYNNAQLKKALCEILIAHKIDTTDNIDQLIISIEEIFKNVMSYQDYWDYWDDAIKNSILPGTSITDNLGNYLSYDSNEEDDILVITEQQKNESPKLQKPNIKKIMEIHKNNLIQDLGIDMSTVCPHCLINDLKGKHASSINNYHNRLHDDSTSEDDENSCYYNYKKEKIECCYEDKQVCINENTNNGYERWTNDILKKCKKVGNLKMYIKYHNLFNKANTN